MHHYSQCLYHLQEIVTGYSHLEYTTQGFPPSQEANAYTSVGQGMTFGPLVSCAKRLPLKNQGLHSQLIYQKLTHPHMYTSYHNTIHTHPQKYYNIYW